MNSPRDFIVPRCEAEPDIHFADNDLLLVIKPSGLLSVPGRHPENKDCLISRLQQRYPQALIVHRLDMDTSGVMVVALNRESHAHLSKQFEQRVVRKEYEALVYGLVEPDKGLIELPLIADWPNRPLQKVCYEHGKPASTAFQVLERDTVKNITRVKLLPRTGRSHQLRVHMKECGHPILGDKFYSQGIATTMVDHLMLHATYLEFSHPVTNKPLTGYARPDF